MKPAALLTLLALLVTACGPVEFVGDAAVLGAKAVVGVADAAL